MKTALITLPVLVSLLGMTPCCLANPVTPDSSLVSRAQTAPGAKGDVSGEASVPKRWTIRTYKDTGCQTYAGANAGAVTADSGCHEFKGTDVAAYLDAKDGGQLKLFLDTNCGSDKLVGTITKVIDCGHLINIDRANPLLRANSYRFFP